MSLTPRYIITNCCGGLQVNIDVNLLNVPGPGLQPGLYKWDAPQLIVAGGLVLNTDQCYIIQQATSGTGQAVVDLADFSFLELGTSQDCADYDESPCSCPWLYYVSPCCPEFGTQGAAAQQVNLVLSDIPYADGTFNYLGATTLPITGTDLILEPGQCYSFTRNLQDPPVATLISLDFSSANWGTLDPDLNCDDPRCPDCPQEGITYLKYEPCCEGFSTIYVRTESYSGTGGELQGQYQQSGAGNIGPIVNPAAYTGVFIFNGTALPVNNAAPFVPGQCYTGTLHTLGSEVAPAPQDETDYNNLPLAPYSTQLGKVGDCEGPPCPECNPIVYALTNCEGITINTETDLSAYIGTYIELDGIEGCWFVQEYSPVSGDIGNPVPDTISKFSKLPINNTLPGLQTQPVTVVGPCDGCDCKCYEVIGYTGTYTYIDCETGKSVNVFSSGADRFCAAARPNIVGKEGIDYTLIIGDECVDNECVDKCFLLTNCDPTAHPEQDATITSTLQSLSQYAATNQVVVLSGYDGCWTVQVTEECECPVDVTVIRDFRDCEDCLGITAYKLSNCEKINEVLYTLQDFSAYVGKVIKDDCACWVVERIDYQPPSQTTITSPVVFEDCTTCLTTYYTLTDCDNPGSVIITSTNLSAYVGQVVKVEGCTPCYEVALYEGADAPETWQEVTVTEASATCFDCKQLVPRCSTVFNNSTEDRTFTFINANGDSEETGIVKSGHFSLRYCVQYWDEPDSFIYNFYGDCKVFEYDNTPVSGECNCIDVYIETSTGTTVYKAVHTGEFYNSEKVFDLVISGVNYKLWGAIGGAWSISTALGSTVDEVGRIKSGVTECPVAVAGSWTPGVLPGGVIVISLFTLEGACPTIIVKEGHCVQDFPNKRKVKPGYNTPICSAEKYDKITCKFADIAYKKVLELRYGISNCCPEEDEKWLIKKELIELQALTDPDYKCDVSTDCCNHTSTDCSCNS